MTSEVTQADRDAWNAAFEAWDNGRNGFNSGGDHEAAIAIIANHRLTAQSGEGRSGAGEDALREVLKPFAKAYDEAKADQENGATNSAPQQYVRLYDFRRAAHALAALNARQSGEGEIERLSEVLDVGEKFLNACFSAWSCGEPYHRVKTMMDRADEFRASLDSIAALRATDDAGGSS